MSAAILTVGLHKRYGPLNALRGLDLAIEPGTVFGLIGPNGAGKTTTLRMLLDIIRPTSGSAHILGQPVSSGGPPLRRRIGYVPGEVRLDGRATGRDVLRFYREVSGTVSSARAEALAERLDAELDRPIRKLSRGNRQKIGLIQAFQHSPEVLILDEPTSGLDPLMQREFLSLVREARDAGQTVLLSSHVLSEIEHVADELAVLSHGTVVAHGDVSSLRLSSIRRLSATVSDASAPEVSQALARIPRLAGLRVEATEGAVRVEATIEGEIDAVLKTLARFTVAGMTLTEPDLEESVLALYGEQRNGGERRG